MNNNQAQLPKANILVVDDTPDNLRLLSTMLTQMGHEVRRVINGQTALKTAQVAPPDLILLDIMMPDMNGYEVCQHLKASRATCDIPVIFISALDEVLDKVKAFAVGGVDYITKPFSEEEVFARVENNLTIRRLQKQLTEQNARLQQEIRDRQRSEAKFRNLFENSLVGIFCTRTEDGLILEANQRLIQMLGYSCAADVINQKSASDLYVDLSARQQMLAQLQAKGEVHNLKMQIRKRDGSKIWVLISARMNVEEDCLEGVVTDIARSP